MGRTNNSHDEEMEGRDLDLQRAKREREKNWLEIPKENKYETNLCDDK